MSESESSSTLNTEPSAPSSTSLPPVIPLPPIRVPLSASQYHTWKAHVTALLNGSELSKYVDSSIPRPLDTAPEYETWFQQDRLLLAAFIASAEPDAKPTVSSATTAAQAWDDLKNLFDSRISPEDVLELLKPHPKKWGKLTSAPRPRMHKVSYRLRLNKRSNESSVYDPVMVSLGPYHHGREELSQAEDFKHLCLHWCTNGSDTKKTRLYYRVLDRIDEIRDCYAEDSVLDKFSDHKLAKMMLLDSCFIFNFVENRTRKKINNWPKCLGMAAAIPFAARDIMVIENQIPFFLLKMLIEAEYDKEEGRKLLQKFLGWMLSLKEDQAVIPRQDADPPLHILEACWRVIAENTDKEDGIHSLCGFQWPELLSISNKKDGIRSFCGFRWPELLSIRNKKDRIHSFCGFRKSNLPSVHHRSNKKTGYHTCPSVTDMKQKGIYFYPNSSYSIKDIRFKSYVVFGKLGLPVRSLSNQTPVILSNMIAYEISPDAKTNLAVLSYTNFMKSLIETPDDVKELLQKGIFQFNRLANLEQVVELFNSIDTFGLEDEMIYKDVIQRVGDHCNSKGKTWMAELVHGKLKSPWTIIGLLTAILLLVLTFLQTYYTMHPV